MYNFKLRVRKQWQLNSKLFKSIADWTVLLYLLIPAVLFVYYLYREIKGEFGVFEVIPLPISIFLLLLITGGGYIRTFVEPGDQLFLIQHKGTFTRLKAYSLAYSIVKQALLIGASLLLFSVVHLHHYNQTIVGLIDLGILLLIANVVNTLLYLKFNQKFILFLMNLGQFILLTLMAVYIKWPVSTAIYTVLFILLCVFYWINYVKSTKYFDKQTDPEIQSYYKWQTMIFSASQELKSVKPSKLPVKSPFLFKNRIFKKNDDFLLDLLSKTILRHKKYIWGYLRLVLVIIGLTFALPLWTDVALVGIAYFMLKSWVESLVLEIKGHSIFVVYQVADSEWIQTEKILSKYLAVYPVVLIVLIIGLTEFLM